MFPTALAGDFNASDMYPMYDIVQSEIWNHYANGNNQPPTDTDFDRALLKGVAIQPERVLPMESVLDMPPTAKCRLFLSIYKQLPRNV